MKAFIADDGKLRVRIGHENLGSEFFGPRYGGTGAIRLRPLADGWFRSYRPDGHGYRGTAALPEAEFGRVQEHLPGARVTDVSGGSLSMQVPEDDLRMLRERIVPLSTRVARFERDLAVMFGGFEVAPFAPSGIGLFHLGDRAFNALRTPLRTRSRFGALDAEADMPVVATRLPSARLLREGDMSVVEIDGADLALLLGMAEEA